jgi:hypothetical protein
MHTHLVQCQLLNRQKFNVKNYTAAYNAAFPGSATIIDPVTGFPYALGVYIPGFGPPLNYKTGNPTALGGNPNITPFLTGLPIVPLRPTRPDGKILCNTRRGWSTCGPLLPNGQGRDCADLNFPFDPFAACRCVCSAATSWTTGINEMMRICY